MSEIRFYLEEIKELQKELTLLNNKTKLLKDRKKTIETKIEKFLVDKKINKMRCGNTIVSIDNTVQRKRKIKKEKEKDIKDTLQNAGIYNKDLVDKVIQQTKGTISTKYKLNIQN
jgi:uncharacterized protein (DUF342 family)